MNELQARAEEWIKRSWKAGKWSPNAVINSDGELVDDRLKAGLMPTPVTRDLRWGVPVPVEGEDIHAMRGKVLCESSRLGHRSYLTFRNRCLGMPTPCNHYHFTIPRPYTQFDAPIGY